MMPKKRDQDDFKKKYPALEKHFKSDGRTGAKIDPSLKTEPKNRKHHKTHQQRHHAVAVRPMNPYVPIHLQNVGIMQRHPNRPVIAVTSSKSDHKKKDKEPMGDRFKHWVYNTVTSTRSNYNSKVCIKLGEAVYFKQSKANQTARLLHEIYLNRPELEPY